MTELITKSFDLELHKFDSDEGLIKAYVTTFGNVDKVGDIIAPDALNKFVKEFNEEERVLAMLWNHKQDDPIGQWTKFEINSRGVKGTGEIFTEVSRGADTRALIRRGVVGSVSIGFVSKTHEQLEDGGRLFKEIELREVSVVLNPANPKAKITSAKNTDGKIDIRKLEEILRDVDLSQRERKAIIAGAVKELSNLRDVVDSRKSLIAGVASLLNKE